MPDQSLRSVTVITNSSTDWAATGSMLQGIGTIVGALAVITAALVGGNTFRAWRRQQLLQRHMSLAEKIMVAIYQARDALAEIRSPWMMGFEQDAAGDTLIKDGVDFSSLDQQKARRLKHAQAIYNRVASHQDVWNDLEQSKAATWAYFGDEIPRQIDIILKQVHLVRVNAEAYADDEGNDREFSKKIREAISSGRSPGNADTLALAVSDAVNAIEERLKPLLQDVAGQTQLAFKEAIAGLSRGMSSPTGQLAKRLLDHFPF